MSTYKVVITAESTDDNPEVSLEVKWEPKLSDSDLQGLGYIPAAYNFVDTTLITAAMMATNGDQYIEEDLADDRTIN